MDIFAHGFWSYIIFSKSKYVLLAILFGILPDILSWGLWLFYPNKNGFTWSNPDFSLVPKWIFTLYGFTHSLLIIIIVFAAVFLILNKIPIYLYAWLIHVLIDIPTHARDFLPTPFLWPVSNWAFPGISWGNKYFMIANYSLIIFFLLYVNSTKFVILFEHIKNYFKNLF